MKKKIIIMLLFSVAMGFAQDKRVSGMVSDKTGAIPGVNVVVKGTTRSTQTDFDGKYSIAAKASEILVFSFIGFKTREVAAWSSETINIRLVEDIVYINVYEGPPIQMKQRPKRWVVDRTYLDSIPKYKNDYLLIVDGIEMKYRKFKKIKRETIESLHTDPPKAVANSDKGKKRTILYVTTRKTPEKM